MTREELKMHHYNMWNFIAKEIIRTKTVVDIGYCKRIYCDGVELSPLRLCFMCELAYSCRPYYHYDICKYCPSVLQKDGEHVDGCLNGVYEECLDTSHPLIQLHIVELIRDSWKD